MSEVGIAHQNNYDIDQPDIVDLLVNDFSSTLHKWRDPDTIKGEGDTALEAKAQLYSDSSIIGK